MECVPEIGILEIPFPDRREVQVASPRRGVAKMVAPHAETG